MRIGHDQDEPIRWVVAALEREASLQRLTIAETHLELNGGSRVRASDHRVPGPELGTERQRRKRNLGSVSERRTNAREDAG